jgi:D-aspartate ligase
MMGPGSPRRRRPTGPTALVLGGTELVRPLALAGIPSRIVAPPGDVSRYSRHVVAVLPSDSIASAGRDDEVLACLLGYGRSQPEPPVLFYESDEHLLFVSRHRRALSDAFRFVIADEATVEALVDKARFQELCERLSLPVPATRIATPGGAQPPEEVMELGFPLIVKPHYRGDKRWEFIEPRAKVWRIDSPEQLQALWPRLSALGGQLVVQQCIDGPESRIESYHVYVNHHGDIAAEFTGRKIRTRPLQYGHTTALTITDAEDVARSGRELVRVLGLRGVAKFDFKRGSDGTLHLLEVNPRFNLWHHPGARARVNIPALVYADLSGGTRPKPARLRSGVRWCSPRDFKAAREAGIPFLRWLPWALGCQAKETWAWNDPMPFLAFGALGATRAVGRLHEAVRPKPEADSSHGVDDAPRILAPGGGWDVPPAERR